MIRIGFILTFTAVHVVGSALLPEGARPGFLLSSHLATKLLAAAGALAAYATMRPHDYMRRFWAPLGLSYLLLALSEDSLAVALCPGNVAAGSLLGALALISGNLLGVVASAVLALTYRRAGLATPLGWRGATAYLLAVLLSVGLVFANLRHDVGEALAGGGAPSFASAVSYACDALTFVLLVPVLRYTLRLGRSKLSAPWWAFAASGTGWLLFSALERLQISGSPLPSEALRTLATLLAGLSGLLQIDLVLEARRQSAGARTAA